MKFRPKHLLIIVAFAFFGTMTYLQPLVALIVIGASMLALCLVYLIIATTENSWTPWRKS